MSEKVNWYALLPFSNIELLIPQDKIRKTFYFNKDEFPFSKDNLSIYSIEDLFFLPDIFSDFQYPSSASHTGFLIDSENSFIVITKVIPRMVDIDPLEFKSFPGKMGTKFKSKGLAGFRFLNEKLQILLDLPALVK